MMTIYDFSFNTKWEKYKPKRSPVEQPALDTAKQSQEAATGNQAAAQGTYGQFEGPVQQSPFYKALLTAGTEGTANAYQNARSNVRSRAKAAGFGNEASGVTQGAEGQIDAAQAAAQARVPGQAMLGATGPALAAAGGTAGIGATQSATGLGYEKTGASLEEQYMQQQQDFKNMLLKAGIGAGTSALTAGLMPGGFLYPGGGATTV